MAQRKTLTGRQIVVLRWISDGRPCGVLADADDHHSARISAGALRRRGLVTTAGRGPTWSATITSAGKDYLERVDGPNPPVPREPNRKGSAALIEEIVEAGGDLRVPVRTWTSPAGTPDYEQRVAGAERRGLVPLGKRLVVSRSGGELVIELRDAAKGTPAAVAAVPVPERVSRYHSAVVEFRGLENVHRISRAQFARASRILQALVVESERRGYGAGITRTSGNVARLAADSTEHGGDLVVTIEGVAVTLHLREDGVSRPQHHTVSNCGYWSDPRRARPSYVHERGASGQLRISVLSPYTTTKRRSSWADGKRQRIEDLLPGVLMEVETRAAEERERRHLERLAAERRKRQWEAAMDQARLRHLEDLRAEVLVDEIDRWRRAAGIRDYCDALAAAPANGPAAAEWIAWARAYANRLDPTMTRRRLPQAPPNPSPSDLAPFLDGWSPYGPNLR